MNGNRTRDFPAQGQNFHLASASIHTKAASIADYLVGVQTEYSWKEGHAVA
jgi:hypothetical protein